MLLHQPSFLFSCCFSSCDASVEPIQKEMEMGRLVNHATGKGANCRMKLLELNKLPVLCLFALRDIQEGEELLYDYGLPRGYFDPPAPGPFTNCRTSFMTKLWDLACRRNRDLHKRAPYVAKRLENQRYSFVGSRLCQEEEVI